MKNLFGYLQWVWRNWEWWQRSFIVAMILTFTSIFISKPYDIIVGMTGWAIIMFWLGKWWIVDVMIASYNKYKKQRDELFDTIKGN
jgi:hypothetical protein